MAKDRDGIVFLTRAEAREALRKHWIATRSREELLAMGEPNWERMRNYEFEYTLTAHLGGDHVIAEWCPFNGRFCALRDYVDAPHPPMAGGRDAPGVGRPWRNFDGSLTEVFEPSCYAPRH